MPSKRSFRKPFQEQLEAIRTRTGNLIPTARWDDIERNAHDRGFMVAGAMKADLLSDFANAIEKAIDEGQGLDWFGDNFDDIVARHGWEFNGPRNWRTRVIYQTNMSTSYAAGRLAQLRDPELQSVAPLWMYVHGGSADPRPDHLLWDGIVLPSDDPWWTTHYTPNGWGCTCSVMAVSEETARRLGGRFEEPPEDGPNSIDQGWDYMPGANVEREIREQVASKAESLHPSLAGMFLRDNATSELFKRWYDSPVGDWPLAKLTADDAKLLGTRRTVASMSASTAKEQLQDAGIAASEYQRAQVVIDRHTHKLEQDNRLVFGRIQGERVRVVEVENNNGLRVTSYRVLSIEEAQRDLFIAQLLQNGVR